MDDLRVGGLLRAVRRRRNLRQTDVASIAGLSQQTVSRVEHGQFEKAGLRGVRAVATALGVSLPFDPKSAYVDLAGVADARHLAVVDAMVHRLNDAGWQVRLEYSYNLYGERGCVDILAWHAAQLALLIVEAKSELVDAQALLRVVDVRDRVLRQVVRRELGWSPRSVASIVVFADDTTNRRRVAQHEQVFDAALPARGAAIGGWIHDPDGDLRGIAFVTVAPGRRAQRNPGGRGRIRRREGQSGMH